MFAVIAASLILSQTSSLFTLDLNRGSKLVASSRNLWISVPLNFKKEDMRKEDRMTLDYPELFTALISFKRNNVPGSVWKDHSRCSPWCSLWRQSHLPAQCSVAPASARWARSHHRSDFCRWRLPVWRCNASAWAAQSPLLFLSPHCLCWPACIINKTAKDVCSINKQKQN